MKLIVGLGNPGPTYEWTRHNAGFWVIDLLAERMGLKFTAEKWKAAYTSGKFESRPIAMLKPLVFMNLSGSPVTAAVSFFNLDLENLLVIHDDVDLPVGAIRIKHGGGSAGHKGVQSIMERLGTGNFYRLRFGVGRPENPEMDTADFVLQKLKMEERVEFRQWAQYAADAAMCLLKEGLSAAQTKFHTR